MHSKRIIKRRIARRHEPERKLIERIHVYLRKKGWRLREHKGRYVIVDLLRGDAIHARAILAAGFRFLNAE
jgi:predicted transcriptional regulator of viral defense system